MDGRHSTAIFFVLLHRSYLRCMRYMKWLSLIMACLVIIACFFPWISFEARSVTIEGMKDSEYGKPGLFHLILCGLFIIFSLLGKVWSQRTAFFISAFNIAWALRNYILIPSCVGGTCPEKHTAIYVILICSILTSIFILFSTANVKPVATDNKS